MPELPSHSLDPLLERDPELRRLEDALGAAGAGSGSLTLIEGAAGVGKTALLTAARGRAAEIGMRVLWARGDDLERDLAFGVVRQLFEPVLARAQASERSELLSGAAHLASPALLLESGASPAGSDPTAALHGLYWLCANLAERGPVALMVDDAQWADAASLRWLAYLERRFDALPVLVALALRSGELTQETPPLAALVGLPGAERLALRPLSEDGAAELVKRATDGVAPVAFSRACYQTSGGNPFYLRELLRVIRDDALEPTAENAARIPEVAPTTVARSVLLRLGRLGTDAAALARAVAVLGPDAELRYASALAHLDAEAAQLAADRLVAAEILREGKPLAFAHQILATSVTSDLESGARSVEHKRAARLLDSEGAGPDRVALHLLVSEPQGDEWVLERLLAAAAVSLERSAPEAAESSLQRALAEPPPRERRADVLFELGRVEGLTSSETCIDHLIEAVERTEDVHLRAERTRELVTKLQTAGRTAEAVAACDRVLAALEGSDRELALRLEAARYRAAIQDPDRVGSVGSSIERFRGTLTGRTPAERGALVDLAVRAAALGTSAAEVVEMASLALADGRLVAEEGGDSIVVFEVINALINADRLDDADGIIEQALAEVRRRGSLTGFVQVYTFRAHAHLRRGLVAEAEADARGALEAARHDTPAFFLPATFAFLVEALVERDDLGAAEDVLHSSGLDKDQPGLVPFTMLLHSRAVLRLAQGRAPEALADALWCGERQERHRIPNPALLPWRSTAALAYAATGEREAARPFARQETVLARTFGAPRTTGVALRAAGLVELTGRGLALLEEAAEILARSPARLEHARTLVDLGTALRHSGEGAAARQRLREGLDLAHQCGATAVAKRARTELSAAGARPRRLALRGVESLTPSEQRVAEMAARGMFNRQIAEALFVTRRTVETHLTHVYSKLDIGSREELPAALGADAEADLGEPAS